jgi:type VI secretion system secreted protein Hcp
MAVDYFLKLPGSGIEGESEVEGHKNEIQVLSWSWGAANISSVSGTGGSGAGKADLSDVSMMLNFDQSTPKFFKAICAGTHIASGTLSAIKAGTDGKPYLTADFTEIFITGLQMSAAGEVPAVSLSFSYNQIEMNYFMQDEKGVVKNAGKVTYSTKTNKLS